MAITAADLVPLLVEHLPRQRWFGAAPPVSDAVTVATLDEIEEGVFWVLVDVAEVGRFQLFLAIHDANDPPDFLHGKDSEVLGMVDIDGAMVVVHDALIDPVAAIAVLEHVAPGQTATSVRPLNVEQSNTSVVYDERLITKVFRRIHEGANPDIEVTEALGRVGFDCSSAPVAVWRRDGHDLAVVREYLVGSTDGIAFAEVSFRDLYDRKLAPNEVGGDFGPEARRLGGVTARLHLALADAFGGEPGDAAAWAAQMVDDLEMFDREASIDHRTARLAYDDLRSVADPGSAIRIHGDYHLGQTLRTDHGWFVLDFEGEPSRPLADRVVPSSPLRDVAGMLRSFQYAARIALNERAAPNPQLIELATQWEDRAAAMFVEGYRSVEGIDALTPADDDSWFRVLRAFELQKAVYEMAYERDHRPQWLDIPTAAVRRLLAVASTT